MYLEKINNKGTTNGYYNKQRDLYTKHKISHLN